MRRRRPGPDVPTARTAPRGLTLLEALVSLTLMGVCLGVIADLFVSTQRATVFANEHTDRAVRALRAATRTMGAELRQARFSDVDCKSAGSVTLLRVKPDFELASPSPIGGGYPYPSPSQTPVVEYKVRYYVEQRAGEPPALYREADDRTTVVAQDIYTMEAVRNESDQTVTITLQTSPDTGRMRMVQIAEPLCVGADR